MMISGGLAGLAGASEILGTNARLTPGFSPGWGFDAIALALLGGSRPLGVVGAALLFGALRAGATPMQAATGIPIDLVVVIQALVIMFIAAPGPRARRSTASGWRGRPGPSLRSRGGAHDRGDAIGVPLTGSGSGISLRRQRASGSSTWSSPR